MPQDQAGSKGKDITETGAFDTIVIGGGTAGCVLAARLAENPGHRVALIEAGPDFGPADNGNWPPAIRSAIFSDTPYDWGYYTKVAGRPIWYKRGKIMGGSSSINAAGINWGLRQDYDDWATLGNPGWDFESLLPFFHRVERLENDDAPGRGRSGALIVTRNEAVPSAYLEAVAAAYAAAGLPFNVDVSGPDARIGVGQGTRNARGGVRFHAASAYLDDARQRPNLTIIPDAEADRILWSGTQAAAVSAVRAGERLTLPAGRLVLAAGACGSPQILERSGIGRATLLRPLLGGQAKLRDLPGVGANLRDHCSVALSMQAKMGAYARLVQSEGAELPLRTSLSARVKSRPDLDAFDLDIFASHWLQTPPSREVETFNWSIYLVHPAAVGSIHIVSPDLSDHPQIETGFGAGEDLEALSRAIEWLRELNLHPSLREWHDGEASPGASVEGTALKRWILENLNSYHHTVGTCKMGPANDPLAVVDHNGCVYGFDNLYVADASIMPTIPRGMINLTVYAIAEKLAAGLV